MDQPPQPQWQPPPPQKQWYKTSGGIILLLFLFFPVGIYLMWRYATWGNQAKLVVTGIFAVLVIIYSVSNAATPKSQVTSQPTVEQSQPTTGPTQAPESTEVPTPKPAITLFDQSNQSSGLSFANSTAFQASGTLKIEYSCQHSVKDGIDVQLNLLALTPDGLADKAVWSVKMDCPDSGTETITVGSGQYKATVATTSDVGWSLKIVQQ